MDQGTLLSVAKSLHIIFVVAWFAGLFYVPRLFIYQTEAYSQPGQQMLVDRFKLMANRLWYIITWPACVLSTLFALWMLYLYPTYLSAPWMHLKLGLVMLLLAYHGSLQWLYNRLQRDLYPFSSTRLRLFNEVPTLLLFAIVFTVVFKDTRSWALGLGGIVLLGVALTLGVFIYRKVRSGKGN